MHGRPSHKELYGKLEKASEAALAGRIRLVEPEIILADLLELDFLVEDLADRLPSILKEINPRCYIGQRPPQRSYENPVIGCELFAFKWMSRTFGCSMYLKLTLKDEYLWIVSLHIHREKKGRNQMNCPNDHGPMNLKKMCKEIDFRGKLIRFDAEHFVCPACGLEADDIPNAAANQRKISEAYRKAANLMTGEEIVQARNGKGWSQEQLARAMNVGIASVKRWELGQIQTRVMDDLLRRVFSDDGMSCNPYTGNRSLSLPRVKLLLMEFEKELGRKLLIPNDKFLYAAKYAWYADMTAFRETGQSMTGGTYAALPQGPQLNNYKDLVKPIMDSDETGAEPLTEREKRIIKRIAMKFPSNQAIYQAAHNEDAWKTKKTGELIPYSDADGLRAE